MAKIYVLGAGTPVPSPQRFGTSFVVETGGEHLMFDCGPAATHKLVKAGLWSTDISQLFFTHHHYDHNVDYPCLLLNRWDQSIGQEQDLHVYGPAPTTQLTENLIGEDTGAFWDDIRARMNHPGSQNVFVNRGGTLPRQPPTVRTHDIEPGYELDGDRWQIRTGWASHAQPWLDSIAYRLETPTGSITFTGDTKLCDEVIDLAAGSDLLMCMCWDDQDRMEDLNETIFGMCGTRDAATIAARAGVKQLALVHSHSNMDSEETQDKAMRDIHRIYDGEVVIAHEGLQLTMDGGGVTSSADKESGGR